MLGVADLTRNESDDDEWGELMLAMFCICHVIGRVVLIAAPVVLLMVVIGEKIRPRPIAQRSEQRTHNPLVLGSNPSRPTIGEVWKTD